MDSWKTGISDLADAIVTVPETPEPVARFIEESRNEPIIVG